MACVSIRIRRDTLSNWEKTNPVLKEGEMSFVTDKFMIKFGDGKTKWKDLKCVINISELQTVLSNYDINIAQLQELITYVDETTKGQLQQIEDAIEALDGIIGEKIGIDDATAGTSTTYSSIHLERIFDKLKKDSGYYKIVDSTDERDAIPMEERRIGMLVYVVGDKTYQLIGTVENTGWEVFSSGSGTGGGAVPELAYTSDYPEGKKIYYSVGDNAVIFVRFSSMTYGDCTLRVYKDNVLLKTITSPKGTIAIDLGTLTTEGTSTYRISGMDYLGIAAPEDLLFTVVCGGLSLLSTFDSVINNTVFEENTAISIPYTVKCSDTSQIVKILCSITKENGTTTQEIINTGSYQKTGNWYIGLKSRGAYTITMQAYTGTSISDESDNVLVSSEITYSINILGSGEISIASELSPSGINVNTYLSIPFRVSGKNTSLLLMKGTLYKVSNYGTPSESLTIQAQTPDSGIQAAVGALSYWFIGRLPAGTYKYSMRSYTLDNQVSSIDAAEGYFNVEISTNDGVQPVTENLIAWFDANDMRNTVENPDIWNNKVSEYPQYQIKLHNLNYNTNGWKHIDETLSDADNGEMMLKFTGDSYGEMINKNTGERFCPLANFNDGTEGYALEVAFRTRCVGEMDSRVITCQKGIDLNTAGFAITHDNLYIGSSSQNEKLGFAEDEWIHAVFVIDRNIRSLQNVGLTNIENMNPIPTMRIYINGVLCSVTALSNDKFLDSLGNAYPLLINTALSNNTPSYFGECEIKLLRVYNHYLTSSQVLQNYISSKYDLEEQAVLLSKNDVTTNQLPIVTFKRKKNIANNSTFEVLNSITDKATSNSTFVDCVVEIQNTDGTITVWDNVEVFLQGTSSLQYPVKNYKIKLYTDETKSKKKKVQMQDDWQPENTFTLKCDYMESSHLNNTPTAKFYNHLIDVLVKDGGQPSPAKANGMKDAIDGFPVIVYYTDDESDADKLVLVGSFMFNIDKKGKSLGFEVKVKDKNGNPFHDKDGNEIKNVCQSYEGTANSSDTAGCFYRLSQSIQNIYNYYIESCYEDAYVKYLKAHNLSADNFSMSDFKNTAEGQAVTYMTFEEFKEDYSEWDYMQNDFEARYDYYELEDIENPTEEDYEYGLGALRDMVNGVSDAVDEGSFRNYCDKHFNFTYAAAYYLQMIVFGQVDNAGKNSMWDTWDGETWYVRPYDMDTQAGLSNTGTESIGVDAEMIPAMSPTVASGTFAAYTTNELTELRYASYNTKTSKFWNTFANVYKEELKIIYQNLRKSIYDIDYIMKFYQSYTTDLIGEIFYNKDMAAKYLTQTSATNTEYLKMLHGNRIQKFKQWIKQRLDFCDTIFDYRYSEDNTNSINGEISLRSDAYLLTNNTGEATDEASTLKAYIGILTYTPQYVTVSVGSGRDAIVTAYVSQDSTYIDPDTKREVRGTLFTIPIKATDKEITISASGGIQLLNKLEDLNVRDLTIANATKILRLDLQGSSRMARLILGNNKYLRELNCNGSVQLGTANGGQVLDLTGCKNIQNLDITNTKLVTVNFAEGSNLKRAILSKSNVRNLYFKSLEFLTEVNIDGCENITEYIIDSCSALQEVSLSNSPIVVFNAINCLNLKSVDVSNCRVLETFELTNCPNVEKLMMANNNGSMMNDLQLYTLYKLKYLDVSNSTSLNNIRFPKYENAEEATRVAIIKAENPTYTDEQCNAQLWHNLTTFIIRNSSIKSIQYGSAEIAAEDKSCNMAQLTKLSSITFQNCTSITEINNLVYTAANMSNLFNGCTYLKKITGKLICNSNASGMFQYCLNLIDINALELDFSGVTTISNIFNCATNGGGRGKATYQMLRKILYACDESLTRIDNAIMYCNAGAELPTDIFAHTPNIVSANSAFYSTTLSTLRKGVFDNLTKLKNANMMFYACNALTSVDQNVFDNAVSLTTVSRMFAQCTALKNFIHNNCNIFANCPDIGSTYAMFYNCASLLNTNGLTGMLDPLTKLVDASYMFEHCTAFTGSIPNGFFAKNIALTTANGVFGNCNHITGLPSRLFRVNSEDTNTLPSLINAKSMFYNCTALIGDITSDFFAGAPNVRSIGAALTDYIPNSSNRFTLYGFFGNTGVTGYFEDFLNCLPSLQDVSYLFYHSNANNSLKYCYYRRGNTEYQYNNSLSINMFSNNHLIQNIAYLFNNCTGLSGCIPIKTENGIITSIFEPFKDTLVNASHVFNGCTLLSGIDLDNSVPVGIHKELLAGFNNLQDVQYFLANNTNHTMTIPEGLFDNCTSLKDVSYFFYNCSQLQGQIPVTMFNDCRNTLTNVAYMFSGCILLEGNLPTGLQTEDEDGNIIVVQKGFLADCLNLTNASYLFYGCEKLTGAIPSDIFYTSSITDRYESLTTIAGMFYKCRKLDSAYYDSATGNKYLCSENIFTKCIALTNVSDTFRELLAMPSCILPERLFMRQTNLQYAQRTFWSVTNLTGAVTATFMMNCINTLLSVYGLFAFTKISSVATGFLHGTVKNTKLQQVGALFFNVSTLTGVLPYFWDGNIFSAIINDTNGYYGAIHNATNVSNYDDAIAASPNWAASLSIWAY